MHSFKDTSWRTVPPCKPDRVPELSAMTYELAVGLRYLKSRRRQTFISLITVISVGGVPLASWS